MKNEIDRHVAARSAAIGTLLLSACMPAADSGRPEESGAALDAANATYIVDGESFSLKSGRAVKPLSPGSAAVNELRLGGKPLCVDFDGDGAKDAAIHLINEPGGSGTFHYVAIIMNHGKNNRPTNTLFLGDRIEEVKMEKGKTTALINFRDRLLSQSFAEKPTVERTMILHYDSADRRAVLNEFSIHSPVAPMPRKG